MANRIQLRRGGSAEWTNSNPVLAQGEIGLELNTGRFKIGDGVSNWSNLRYSRPVESTTATANSLVQRDADGNFAAGTITANLIGNASTAQRIATTRQIQLSGDLVATGTFDGSSNLNLNSTLEILNTLPHYDAGNANATGTYTKVTVDSKGRVVNASTPSTLADYNLNGTVEGSSAQPYDLDLVAIAGHTGTGLYAKTSTGNVATRTIQGTATRIQINNGSGVAGDPTIDMITTAVQAGNYNTESLTSVSAAGSNSEPYGTQTVNATKFTVDAYGRLTSATNVPIATATEGSKYANYDAGTAYVRYDIIQNASKVYQALTSISAGAGAPTHSSGDTGGWRYLAAEATEQKGLASFAQEDFDVDSNGHVTIAAAGVDNTQLQNNKLIFTDGNAVENFELDNELTTSTANTGFNRLNFIKINDTSGNLLFGANNTGDSGAGEIDVNVRSYFSDPDITLDGATAQTLDKTGDGNLTFQLTQDSSSARNLSILSTNAGSGTSTVTITAEDVVDIDASAATGKVHVENARFQSNYIATTDATMNLDPGDDRAVTGLVRVWGDLQVDGVTTTVNSTTMTVDDVVLTLGGDTAPSSDDNLDRGIEFRYYDTQARLGFFGWDTNYTDLTSHEGGYRFLHAATNTSETFAGTDSGIIAGNLKLTSNTNSTSNTTGDLVVAGGVGITQDVNIGGLLDVDGTLRVTNTSRFDNNIVLQGASKTLQLNNGSGTTKIEFQSTTGNASIGGVTDVTGNFNVNTNKFNVVASSGNTTIAGTLGVTGDTTLTGALDANSTVNIAGFTRLEDTNEPSIALNGGTGLYEIQSSDYGAFRFDGGGYVEGDTMFNSDLYINGFIRQKEDVTATFNTQNYLQVRYKFRTGTSAAYTPSYAQDNTSNLRVYGGAGIATDLHIGDDLYIGKLNSGDNVEFQVLGESGNTTIGRSGAGTSSVGTLTVYGDTLLDRDLTVNGDITLGNASSDVLTINSDTTFNDDVKINGDNLTFTIEAQNGTDAFVVDSDNGNTTIAGTLDVDDATTITNTLNVTNGVDFDSTLNVDGQTDLNGALIVDGATTINNSLTLNKASGNLLIQNGSGVTKFSVDTDNGNTDIQGTFNVEGATTIDDTLGVTGITSFTDNTDQSVGGNNYSADGSVRLTGGLGVAKNLAVGEDFTVYGNFVVKGNTTQTGTTVYNNTIEISNTQDATSFADNSVSLTTDGGARISKNAWVGGDLHVWDNANSRNAFYVDVSTGDATLHNNMTIGGDLVVNGTTTTVNSTITTLDDPIITLGGDTAPSSDDAKDRGVEFRYYDSTAKTGFFGLDRSSLEYVFLSNTSNSSEVISGTDGDLRAGSLHLTGSGTTLDVDANANIDGTLTVDGQITSNVSTGTPPLVVASTTKVNNLNADLLDGFTTDSTANANTIVLRDASGDFAANKITVATGTGSGAGIQGNALTADTLKTARTITVDGVVNGNVSFNGSADVTITTTYDDADITALAAQAGTGYMVRSAANTYVHRTFAVTSGSGITLTNADGISGNTTINVASSASSTPDNLVLRDGSGDFAANVITMATATISGAATIGTTLGVTGATTLSSTLGVTGAATLSSTLAVTSNATIGGTLGVTGVSTLTGLLNANGGIAVDTNNFTVNGSTGSVVTAGTLSVGSTSAFTGAITASGGVVGALTGNVTGNVTGDVTGDLTGDVTGNLVANSTALNILPAADSTHNLGSTTVRWANVYADNLNAGGNATIAGNLDLTGNIAVTGTSTFTAEATFATHINLGDNDELRIGDGNDLKILHNGSNSIINDEGVGDLYLGGNASVNITNGALSEFKAKFITDGAVELYHDGSKKFETSATGATITGVLVATSLTGNVTGDVTGNLTGNVTGDVTGDLTGNVTGNLTGNVTGNATSVSVSQSGSVGDYFVGIVANSVGSGTSALRADSGMKFNTGTNVLTVTGGVTADLTGNVTGNLTGNVTGTVSTLSNHDTGDLTEGTNLYYTDARADARIAAATTDDLSEGSTNQYFTEARVQTKLDHAFEQLRAMLNNLATTTTLVLNLSGDPTPGDVVTLGSIVTGGTGYSTSTGVATTSSGSGTGLTVDITASAGVIQSIAVNSDGSGYVAGETITISTGDGNAQVTVGTVKTMAVGNTITGGTSGTTGVITALGATSVTIDTIDGFFKKGETVSAGNVTTLTISTFA
ncbi:tail fiber protein [Synechococcus phage S-P4]|uniref:Tail fiber protein n=1 Tax=Synechococcus phage S-P4 TaxID=2484640 RepID=A0A3G3M5W4_9CAUD|nr:structural protein [Synechococcus phage S-P4]AYR01835.1 tail fiber protein [Synechococcus phage S-P4]